MVLETWQWALLVALVMSGGLGEVVLRERPTERNVRRLAARVRRRASRRGREPLDVLARLLRFNRLGAQVLMGFGVGALVLAVGFGVVFARREGSAAGVDFAAVPLVAGLAIVATGVLYLRQAPRLMERVRTLLESEAATTKEPPTIPPSGT